MPDKNDITKMSASSFQKEFHLDSVLDYVKTGIGSIIEDEVTGRFVAEELKVGFYLVYMKGFDKKITLKFSDVEFTDSYQPKFRVC